MHAGLAEFFAWQRRTQLPDYAAQLARAQLEVLADIMPAGVCEWQAEGIARAKFAFDHIAPAAADVMLTITPQQIDNIERRNTKSNDGYRSDYLQPDPAKRAAATLKRTIDHAETLYGQLDDAQRAWIAVMLKHSPFDPQLWLAERRQRQLDAVQLLRQLNLPGATREQALAGLRAYAEHIERSPRETYRAYADRLMRFNCAFVAELHNITTAEQRHIAADKLGGWKGDLRALITMPASNHGVEWGR